MRVTKTRERNLNSLSSTYFVMYISLFSIAYYDGHIVIAVSHRMALVLILSLYDEGTELFHPRNDLIQNGPPNWLPGARMVLCPPILNRRISHIRVIADAQRTHSLPGHRCVMCNSSRQ
jgi:hypothetical protein